MTEKTVLEFKAKSIVSIDQGLGRYSLVLFQPKQETCALIHDHTGKGIDFTITDDAGTFFPAGRLIIMNAFYSVATDTMVATLRLED